MVGMSDRKIRGSGGTARIFPWGTPPRCALRTSRKGGLTLSKPLLGTTPGLLKRLWVGLSNTVFNSVKDLGLNLFLTVHVFHTGFQCLGHKVIVLWMEFGYTSVVKVYFALLRLLSVLCCRFPPPLDRPPPQCIGGPGRVEPGRPRGHCKGRGSIGPISLRNPGV